MAIVVDVVVGVPDEVEAFDVAFRHAQRRVHEVHRVVEEERDGRVVAGDDANHALEELRLLEGRAVEP